MPNDQPKTLADICARIRTIDESMMRDLDFMAVFLKYLPRDIEAAAERERVKARHDAAALREALENVERVARFCAETPLHTPGYPTDAARADVLYSRIAELGRVARAALSAPARNCDRFATAEEAVAAFADHLRAWENAHGVCSEYPDHPVKVPAGAFAWLFATAQEGGDHA